MEVSLPDVTQTTSATDRLTAASLERFFMRRLISCLILSLGLTAGSIAHAQGGNSTVYYGLGFAESNIDLPDGSGGNLEDDLGTLSALVGWQFSDYFGVQLNLGVASDEADSFLTEPLVSYAAALLRVGFRWDRVGVYLLGGTAGLAVDSGLIDDEEQGDAFGIGINLFGNETTSLNFNYLNIDDGAFTSATIGFQHYFGGFR